MTSIATRTRTLPDSPAELLREIRAEKQAADASDRRQMELAVAWADLHAVGPTLTAAEGCFLSPKTFAGEGSPLIDEFCIPEFATMLGRTCDSAGRFLSECVELAHRLPRLWSAVSSGVVVGWRARSIAAATIDLSMQAAGFVDEQISWCASRVTPTELARVLDRARIRWMPELAAQIEAASLDQRHVTFESDQVGFDGTMRLEAALEIPDALALATAVSSGAERLAALGSTDTLDGRRATALSDLARHQLTLGDGQPSMAQHGTTTHIVIHAHLAATAITAAVVADPSARIEQAGGQVLTVGQIRAWCARPDAKVTIRPVLDLRTRLTTNSYRPSQAIRDHVIARDVTCVFPWCGRNARSCDLDHVIPFDHDRPELGGKTSTGNLAPLCRRHHRLKTHGRWRYEMSNPGTFTWTSPLGYLYCRDQTGSRPIAAADDRRSRSPGTPVTHLR